MILKIIISSILFLIFDLLWMGLVMGGVYKEELAQLLRLEGQNWTALTQPLYFLYPLMGLGISVLAIRSGSTLMQIAFNGAIWGLCVYGVYELTNYSILNNWSFKIVIIDTLWGTVLGAAVATLTSFYLSKFNYF